MNYDADLAAGSLNHFMQIRESELVDEFLKGIATGPSKRYLDFACGSGRILQQISPHFGETVAVDVAASMMEQAREKVPGATFHLADLTKDDPPRVLRPDLRLPFLRQCGELAPSRCSGCCVRASRTTTSS